LAPWLVPDPALALEDQFFQVLCLMSGVIAIFVVIPINSFQNLGPIVGRSIFLFGLAAFVLYGAALNGHRLKKTLLFAFVILLDLLWFPNGGSHGSIGLYFVITSLYLVLFFHGTLRHLGLATVMANAGLLLFLEWRWPNFVHTFDTSADRMMDLGTGYLVSLLIAALFLGVILEGFKRRTGQLKETYEALYQSEERHRLLTDNAADEIWTIDLDGRFTYMSIAVIKQRGFTPAEAMRLTLPDTLTPASAAIVLAALRKAREEVAVGRPCPDFRAELEELHKNGSTIWVDVSATGMTDPSGNFLGIFGVSRDISARKRIEAELLASRASITALLESTSDFVFSVDCNYRLMTFNTAFADYFRRAYRKELWVGAHPSDLLPPNRIADWEEIFGRVLVRGAYLHEFRLLDGRTLEMTLNPIIQDDKTLGISVFGKDITERFRAEAELRRNESQLRDILDQAPVAIYVSRAGIGLYGNRKLLQIMGDVSPEHVVGRPTIELVAPRSRVESLDRTDRRAKGLPVPDEYMLYGLRADGTEWPAQVVMSSVQFQDGPANLAFMIDLTEQFRQVKERERLEAHARQNEKMDSLGNLAGGVAHDMNNVLGAILAMASVHQAKAHTDPALRKDMDTIVKACQRGGTLVKGLLGFAREGLAEQQELDLNLLVKDEVQLLERTTLKKVRLVMHLTPDIPPIMGDPAALSHALMNLCVNALDAMDGSGTLTLRTRKGEDGTVWIDVADDGIGMPKEVLAKALDPFFTTKPLGKGTGLGLPMVFGTVKAHQGNMTISSEPGRGTTVSLCFPAHIGASEPTKQDEGPLSPGAAGSLLVFLVDDDDLVQEAVQAILETLGHRVETANGGEEALAMLMNGLDPDVVILDLNMPGIDGAETLVRLRTLRPDLPVLLSTGRADQNALDLVETHANVSLLSKPFSLQDLRKRLEPIPRSARSPALAKTD